MLAHCNMNMISSENCIIHSSKSVCSKNRANSAMLSKTHFISQSHALKHTRTHLRTHTHTHTHMHCTYTQTLLMSCTLIHLCISTHQNTNMPSSYSFHKLLPYLTLTPILCLVAKFPSRFDLSTPCRTCSPG